VCVWKERSMGNKASLSKRELVALEVESQLSAEEIRNLSKEFAKVSDKNGLVDQKHFKEIVHKTYGTDNQVLVTSIFHLFDADGSKAIDFREFVMAVSYLHNNDFEDSLDILFRCLDLNGDGEISKNELQDCFLLQHRVRKMAVLQASGEDVSIGDVTVQYYDMAKITGQVGEVFSRLDADGNGRITMEEFTNALQQDSRLKETIEGLMMKKPAKGLVKTQITSV